MSLTLNTCGAAASPAVDREELFQSGALIHSVSMAEFHLTKGTNLAATYPPNVSFKNAEELANICFPEGAHLHHHDWVFIFLWDEGPLYGVAFYSRFEDTSITRGALQKSLLLLARKPYFHMFLKVLNFGLQWHFAKFMMNLPEGDNLCVLKTVFDSFNNASSDASSDLVKFSAFNSSFQFSHIPLRYDTFFPGASLLDLVKLLKDKTLLLWKSLLMRHRILFSGAQSPANLVGNCCLAAPQMILPLAGYSRTICPYVSITDIAILHSPSYICGMTNPLFESKPALWDTLISFTNKKAFTFPPNLKLNGRDQKFTKLLLNGVENEGRDDDWLRAQFKAYTREFLQRVEEDNAGKEFATFKYQPLYVTYREALRHRRRNTLTLALSERPDPELLLQKRILNSDDLPADLKNAGKRAGGRRLGLKKK